MRIPLDECLPRKLKSSLQKNHEVQTVREAGWLGKENGELIQLALGRFDVILTVDKEFPAGKATAPPGIIIAVLRAPDTNFETLLPLVPLLETELAGAQPGKRIVIEKR